MSDSNILKSHFVVRKRELIWCNILARLSRVMLTTHRCTLMVQPIHVT